VYSRLRVTTSIPRLIPGVQFTGTYPSRFPPRSSESEKTGPAVAGPSSVVVVDDHPWVRQLTARMVRDAGYDVVEAGSAREALDLLKASGPVRLVLADVIMPGVDGMTLAEQVRELYPDQPIVLMSAYAGMVAEAGRRVTHHRVLTKPFTASQLAQSIGEAVRRH
jgi:CheY-like chemotaxis protein